MGWSTLVRSSSRVNDHKAETTYRLLTAAYFVLADPSQVAGNLRAPIAAFDAQIGRLDRQVWDEGRRTKEGERTTWPSAE